ncbi:hypothetical protein [Halogeometricum limi]|uniref:Uncharacterized protein n=1 Tax=Halogeometricum limi TaxID=555875 RepID=A0A1I6FW15_9EURY|nr:hypothetical protein [Halogeometricum limi]SFR34155.1 hypothetical protein SAMN04488124_0414 [Halogeometricum limi]
MRPSGGGSSSSGGSSSGSRNRSSGGSGGGGSSPSSGGSDPSPDPPGRQTNDPIRPSGGGGGGGSSSNGNSGGSSNGGNSPSPDPQPKSSDPPGRQTDDPFAEGGPSSPDDPGRPRRRPSRNQQPSGTQSDSRSAPEPDTPQVVNRSDLDVDNSAVQYQINQQRGAIERQYGDQLDGDDYQFVIKDSGNVDVRLTDSGRDKLQDQAEMNLVNERVREEVDGDVRSTDVREATEGGYVATVKTADGRTVTRRFVFNEDAAQEFRRRANERREPTTGSQADTTLSSRREPRVSGGGIATNGDAREEQYLREGQMAQDEILERVGATDNDSQLPDDIREEKRQKIARDVGVDPSMVRITGVENGKVRAKVLSEDEARRERERFGDVDWSFGLGGDEDEVEQFLSEQADGYDRFADGVVDANEKYGPTQVITRESYDAVDDYLPEWAQNRLESSTDGRTKAEEFQSGIVAGAVQLGNVPRVAGGVLEAGEFVKYGAEEAAAGRGGDFVTQTLGAGEAAGVSLVDRFKAKPSNTIGQGVGSLAVSAGALGAASKAGKAGTAARYAVQPGEELASSVATRVASRSATGQRFLDAVPGGRIDNEEIAMAATSKLSRTIGRTKRDFVNKFAESEAEKLQQFVRSDNDRAQLQLGGPRRAETRDEPDVVSGEDIDAPRDDRSELARQAQEQVEYETAERYGPEVRDSVPEFQQRRTFEPGPGADSTQDIGRGVERPATEPELNEWDYPLGRTVEENFRQSQALKRVPEDDLRQMLAKQERTDPAAEAAELRRRAERVRLEENMRALRNQREPTGAEVTVDDRQRESLLEQSQRELDQVTDLTARAETRVGERGRTDTRVGTRGRPTELERVGQPEVEMVAEFERLQEMEQERLTELTTETRVDPTFEAARVEQERESELERMWEREQERERERFDEAASDQTRRNQFWDTDIWQNTWRTGIADVEDLWSQEFGGR